MRFSSDQQSTPPSEIVLVLTDGSDKAKRVAEWGLVFVGASGTTVHRIDVLDCLDSGVIIQSDTGSLAERECLRQHPPSASPTQTANRHRRHESTIDVLHGIPHEALLDYVATNAVDRIIVSVRDRTYLEQSLLGCAFTSVSQAATVPVMTIDGTDERYGPQCDGTVVTPTGSRRAEHRDWDWILN